MNNNVNYVIIISIFISDHKNASGLSIYFPFQLQGSDDLKSFSAVSVNPYYMSIVDKITNGYSANEYDNSVFFSQNGKWVNTDCQCEDLDSAYFGAFVRLCSCGKRRFYGPAANSAVYFENCESANCRFNIYDIVLEDQEFAGLGNRTWVK